MKIEHEWVDVPGFDGNYAANRNGQILNRKTDHVLAGILQKKTGYLHTGIHINGLGKSFRTHRLIALTFLPAIEGKTQVNHKNGIKSDNRVENLEWSNASENQFHALSMGLKKVLVGEASSRAKLTSIQVEEIKRRFAEGGISQSGLAKEYGLSQSGISLVLNGKRWKG